MAMHFQYVLRKKKGISFGNKHIMLKLLFFFLTYALHITL